jgi:FeS assembly SUF system protein
MAMNEHRPEQTATTDLKAQVIKVLRSCYDPEIPVNIYELGLIYGIDTDEAGKVSIAMTLTSPNCPVAGTLPQEVKSKVSEIPGTTDVNVELTWDPPWSMEKMSEAAMLQLGIDPLDSSARTVRFGS